MAGELVMKEIRKQKLNLLPIDSEHSALFQCILGEDRQSVRRIILTASGGPFLRKKKEALERVTPEEALAHPNWNMGRKVSIDSATLMNKGLEIIEARWLFNMNPRAIEVVIHPQSIIHSMVEFQDGSIKAQLGVPDMRIPISYALTYPQRWEGDYGFMDFSDSIPMEFLPPDSDAFPCLKLAYQALEAGGTAPAVLNGADEEAVALFLDGRIQFIEIHRAIESALNSHSPISHPDLETINKADRWARDHVLQSFDIMKRNRI
jgi:1-deoxy-D-xylulose-5-phosphate reductoisomerase